MCPDCCRAQLVLTHLYLPSGSPPRIADVHQVYDVSTRFDMVKAAIDRLRAVNPAFADLVARKHT